MWLLLIVINVLHIQLEKAKKREAAFIVTFAKREQEIAELKVSFGSVHFVDKCVDYFVVFEF
jgi:hypothetical protein